MIQKFTGFLRSCFLFQRQPENGWTRKRRVAFWCWNVGFVVLSALGIGAASLLLALGPYPMALANSFLERPLTLLLNLLPVVALMLALYGVTRRSGASFLVTAAVVLGLSLGHYYKLTFRDDPLMFADLLLLKEAGNMAGKYKLFVGKRILLVLLCVAAGYLFLRFLARGRPPLAGRLACGAVGLLALVCLIPSLTSNAVYNGPTANYDRLDNRWSSTQQYIGHGFVYPFLHSVGSAFESPPEGYRESEAAALLAQYEDGDIPEGEKVNVVGIMLEAYNDFTKFGTPKLAQDVYATWHRLEAEGYSGDLVTNIFAGGTVDTERCFLTGYADLPAFRSKTNSYPWYFRSQGYTVEGMHPCFQWFYNRSNINENLGFENYWFVENYFGQYTGDQVAFDNIFFPELLKSYQTATAGGAPYFSFSVTYQGHGPYDSDRCWWGERGDFVVDDGTYTDEQQYILDNYFGSIADTDRHLKELTDYLRDDDKPVVLILFGDHNPWMGDGNSVYTAMGINFDMGAQQGFFDYYATRYIIWANDAAKEALGNDFQGAGPDMGPYFLMNQLFQLCGWDGPAYLQATTPIAQAVPVIHTTGRYLEGDTLTDTPTAQGAALIRDYQWLQYYDKHHFRYRDVD